MRMWSGLAETGSFQDRRVKDQRVLPDVWEVGVCVRAVLGGHCTVN